MMMHDDKMIQKYASNLLLVFVSYLPIEEIIEYLHHYLEKFLNLTFDSWRSLGVRSWVDFAGIYIFLSYLWLEHFGKVFFCLARVQNKVYLNKNEYIK